MKVNILTQPLFCNYGGILQNFALQQVLRRLGHEPMTVNVPTRCPGKAIVWKDMIKTGINLAKRINGSYQYPFLSPHRFAVKEHDLSFPQREFIKKYINKVDEAAPFNAETCNRYPADAWIVGSDQVWRPWCSPYIENCFLDFVPDEVIKVAYAASFGTDKWEISPAMTEQLSRLGTSFKALSVREESGVSLAHDNLGLHVAHVLDPTLLLTPEEYLSVTSPDDLPKGEYIATYVLDINSTKASEIKDISRQFCLPVHKIGQMHKDRFDAVESWIAGIANAEKVITDSFHGTVFSLLFNRPVKVLANNMRGNARLSSLLNQLRPVLESDGFYRMTPESVNWLDQLKKESETWLSNALTN